jgi:hypothetical protein
MRLLITCAEEPSAVGSACREFVSQSYTTGFQTGMLTPILNALRPEDFMIVNNKSRKVINYFAGTSFKQRLSDYPATNTEGLELVRELTEEMRLLSQSNARPLDLFDMFCHWLVAEKEFAPLGIRSGSIRVSGGDEIPATVPDNDETDNIGAPPLEAQSRESHRVQAALAEIGTKMRFRIWVPRNDRAKVLENSPGIRSFLLDELPLNYADVTLRTIEQIDVIWIRGHSIAHAFEVEHTTAIYSGLLRMADLLSIQPDINIRLHIVAPDEKHDKVMREIRRPTFSIFRLLDRPSLYQRCSFIPYSSVTQLSSLRGLEHMTDSVLRDYEEFAEEE